MKIRKSNLETSYFCSYKTFFNLAIFIHFSYLKNFWLTLNNFKYVLLNKNSIWFDNLV